MSEKEKQDYEKAVEEFEKADTDFTFLQKQYVSGQLASQLASEMLARGATPMWVEEQWQIADQQLRALREERNAKLSVAKAALRQLVVLGETQWRGPEGTPSEKKFGRFKVTSVTYRSFDAKSLIAGVQRHNLFDKLLEHKLPHEKTGEMVPVFQQTWEADYKGVLNFLRDHDLQDVIDGAYDEREGTPQVKGAKPVAYLGDEVKD